MKRFLGWMLAVCAGAGAVLGRADGEPAFSPIGLAGPAVFYAPAYGSCVWDGAHDVADCIAAAIAAAAAPTPGRRDFPGGGDVLLPAGTYPIGRPLAISASGVSLASVGAASGVSSDDRLGQARGFFATTLVWAGPSGAGPMLAVAPLADPLAGGLLVADGLRGIMFDARGRLQTGVTLSSLRRSAMDFGCREAAARCVLATTTPLAGHNDLQDDDISLAIEEGNDPETGALTRGADGLVMTACTGPGCTGNVSITDWPRVVIRVRDGTGILSLDSDNTHFGRTLISPLGSGAAVRLVSGGATTFDYLSPGSRPGSVVTASPGLVIRRLDTGNGAQTPLATGAGSVTWRDGEGREHAVGLRGATRIENYTPEPALTLTSTAQSHLAFADAGTQTGQIDLADGVLRLRASNGLDLGNTGKVAIPGAVAMQSSVAFFIRTISEGASDEVQDNDYVVKWNSAAGSTLREVVPACDAQTRGRVLIVKDGSGAAQRHPIAIVPRSGTIDGAAAIAVATAHGAVSLMCDGHADWTVIGRL